MSQVYNPTQSLVDNYDMESPVNAMSAYARFVFSLPAVRTPSNVS